MRMYYVTLPYANVKDGIAIPRKYAILVYRKSNRSQEADVPLYIKLILAGLSLATIGGICNAMLLYVIFLTGGFFS